MTFRAGDTVRHRLSGETWTLACDQNGENVWLAGWPESCADSRDCELDQAATDEERLSMLRHVSRRRGDSGELTYRASLALRNLHDLKLCDAKTCGLCHSAFIESTLAAERAVIEAAKAWQARRHGTATEYSELEHRLDCAVSALAALTERKT